LTSRRAETEVELRDGQTFAIAGLLNNTALSSMRKVPGLGDIPILGYLFKSKAYTKDQTELVVMVTPQIVRRDSVGVSPGLPSLVEPYLGPNEKPIVPPGPYMGSPHPQSRPGGRVENMQQPPQTGATVESTPIQGTAQLPAPPDKKAMKKAAEAAEKQRIADEKQKAAAAKAAAKKAEEDRREAEKLEKARAKQQAEADKKAEEARKKAGQAKQTKSSTGGL
jgi:pilus assembly protein CpaC